MDIFRKRNSELDVPKHKVLSELERYGVGTPEWDTAMRDLERLKAMQSNERSKLSWDAALPVAGNLLMTLIIVGYEQKHVLVSKATGILTRGRPG